MNMSTCASSTLSPCYIIIRVLALSYIDEQIGSQLWTSSAQLQVLTQLRLFSSAPCLDGGIFHSLRARDVCLSLRRSTSIVMVCAIQHTKQKA